MSKPLLLVDVDGVLNCFGAIWGPEYQEREFEPLRTYHNQFTIRCRKGLADNLARLAEHFEMVWCTAWEGEAHPFFGEWLGLGDAVWPHLSWTQGWVGDGATWKLPDVRDHFDGTTRPIAWIDDDLNDDAYRWAARRSEDVAPTLLVRTNPVQGLTDENVDVLIDFAERVDMTTPEPA